MGAEDMSDVLGIIGQGFGYLATAAFFAQYVPQIKLNAKRQSCEGFSSTAMMVKLVGAAFMFTNFLMEDQPPPWSVMGYALINIGQYSTIIGQCAYFHKRPYLCLYFLTPLFCAILSYYFPATIPFTDALKPSTQIVSHIFILAECIRIQSTRGVSMGSQHFNAVGGISGIIMCVLLGQRTSTLMLYVNSLVQALTIYVLWGYYRIMRRRTPQLPIVIPKPRPKARNRAGSGRK